LSFAWTALASLCFLGVLQISCSGQDDKLLGPGDVTPEELRALIPTDLIPSGFSVLQPDADALPVPTPSAPHQEALYSDAAGNRILIGIFASGEPALSKESTPQEICRRWRDFGSGETCPIHEIESPNVGNEATSYTQSSPEGEFRADLFVQNGIHVGITLIGTSETVALAPDLLHAIEARIKASVTQKSGD
jgi:hypothetical protein